MLINFPILSAQVTTRNKNEKNKIIWHYLNICHFQELFSRDAPNEDATTSKIQLTPAQSSLWQDFRCVFMELIQSLALRP